MFRRGASGRGRILAKQLKVPAERWLAEARKALISGGIGGVKVDRLAHSLGVTRGGFYHHFSSAQALLDRLLDSWEAENQFIPDPAGATDPASAVALLDRMANVQILEEDFSPSFDLAIREWARIDERVRARVDVVDADRIDRLTRIFLTLGCDEEEAETRARVLYFHQIGFYALGYHKRLTREERLRSAPTYMRILCGRRFLEVAGEEARKWL